MRRYIYLLLIILLAQSAKAQEVKNQFQFIGEGAAPIDQPDYDLGWGIQFKWLHRLGAGAFTLSVGYTKFGSNEFGSGKRSTLYVMPWMAGYRLKWKKFFVEPQVGYGELGGRMDIGGDYSRPSFGAFFYCVNGGVNLNRFDIGLRYLGASGTGGGGTASWHTRNLQYAGLFTAFNLRKSSN